VHQRPPLQLGAPLPCWVFELVFQHVCCALFVISSSPVYRSSVCHCVSSIEFIAPDVALPYRAPSFTSICGSLHLSDRPCMLSSCVSCMPFSHFLIVFLSPPSSLRPSPASCPLQLFSQTSRTPIVAKEFQIGLYAEADLDHFRNSCSAGFIRERLYLVRPLFCPVVSLLFFLRLLLSRYLELSSDVG